MGRRTSWTIVALLLGLGALLLAYAVRPHTPLEYWAGRLGDADPAARREAADTMGLYARQDGPTRRDFGWDAGRAARGLAALADDPDRDVRLHALVALAALGPDAREAVPALQKALEHDADPSCRIAAADALAAVGPDARGSVAALCRACVGRDGSLRWRAGLALEKVGPGEADAPALRAVVEHFRRRGEPPPPEVARVLRGLGGVADAPPGPARMEPTAGGLTGSLPGQ